MTRCMISASASVKKRMGGMTVTRLRTTVRVAASQNDCWLSVENFG